jgi:putative acetyltransferase
MVHIRPESHDDAEAIRHVNEAAFGTSEEADLVDALRTGGQVLVSLVAEADGRVVGHVLFSRMWIRTADGLMDAVALAPVAVVPECQKQGIGTRLIVDGLGRLRNGGERIVIVLGHPAYYPRFGFSSERARHLASPFPADAFMALDLVPGALDGVTGAVAYPEAFGI